MLTGSVGTSAAAPTTTKRKEIYRYEAPFILYATSWSQHPDPSKKFRLASASFIEEYNNKVGCFEVNFISYLPHYLIMAAVS